MSKIDNLREEVVKAFKDLKFTEENHVYNLKSKTLPSVSSQVKKFYQPFDRGIAKYSAKKEGITEKEMLRRWDKKRDDACAMGTQVHNFGEAYSIECARPSNYAEFAIVQWWLDLDERYELLLTEIPLYSNEGYAGTPDILLYDHEKEVITIADYKTNEDLFKNYKGKKLKKPFSGDLDMPLNKYAIQLNLYQMCLEDKGFKVDDRIIVWLKPDPNECSKHYQEFKVPNHIKKLRKYYGNNITTHFNIKAFN